MADLRNVSLRSSEFFLGRRVKAEYHGSTDPMYRHNCYIEALPKPFETSLIKRKIALAPAYSEEERELQPTERLQAAQRLCNLVVPLPAHYELEQKFSRMLRNGYFARNPLSAQWVKQMQSAYPDRDWDVDGYAGSAVTGSTAAGFSIFGPSGVGKSTLINRLLDLYPQVIAHTDYDGQAFDQQQLVWLKLECPFDGSPRGLCINFFQAVDRIFRTNYADRFINNRRITTDVLLPQMADFAGQLGLGVLVLDEIQRLRSAKDDDAKKLINFFVQLTNGFGVPIVSIGTYKAFSLFTTDFATARRSAGQGDYFLHNFDLDPVWFYFVKNIWRYQWTVEPTAFSEELATALYQESQGIADIAVKLYMFAQWHVIGTENERITPKVFRAVAKENFHAAGPILDALRTGDMEALRKVDDIAPNQAQINMALARAQRRLHLSGTLATIGNENKQERSDEPVGALPHERLTLLLHGFGYDNATATKCAKAACDRFAADTDMKRAAEEAFRLAREADVEKKEAAAAKIVKAEKRPAKKAAASTISGDLREIIKKAPKGTSPYDALHAAGIIKSALEFIPGGTDDATLPSTAPPG